MAAKRFNVIQPVEDDGLIIPEVGNWSEKKYSLVGQYCGIFTKAMKDKFNLVYLDLFAGAGYAKIRETGAIVKNAGLIAMSTEKAFDYHLFNELDREKYEALTQRCSRHAGDRRWATFNLDANKDIEAILQNAPVLENGKGSLMFCFADPCAFELKFSTVRVLARRKVDLLILLALQMAGKRNLHNYAEEDNETIARFIDNPDWRSEFDHKVGAKDFARYIAGQYDKRMAELKYNTNVEKALITTDTGLKLYYLAFYSRNDLGDKFFKAVKAASNDQYGLGF